MNEIVVTALVLASVWIVSLLIAIAASALDSRIALRLRHPGWRGGTLRDNVLRRVADVLRLLSSRSGSRAPCDRTLSAWGAALACGFPLFALTLVPVAPGHPLADIPVGPFLVLAGIGPGLPWILLSMASGDDTPTLVRLLRRRLAVTLVLLCTASTTATAADAGSFLAIVETQTHLLDWNGISQLPSFILFLAAAVAARAMYSSPGSSPLGATPVAPPPGAGGWVLALTGVGAALERVVLAVVLVSLFLGGSSMGAPWPLETGWPAASSIVLGLKVLAVLALWGLADAALPLRSSAAVERWTWKGLIPIAAANMVVFALLERV